MNEYLYSNDVRGWKEQLLVCLPKSNLKHLKKFQTLILSVDNGIKPALLLDFGIIHITGIKNWINLLKLNNSISNKLSILDLNGEVFIYHFNQSMTILHKYIEINYNTSDSFKKSNSDYQIYKDESKKSANAKIYRDIPSTSEFIENQTINEYLPAHKKRNFPILVDISSGLNCPCIINTEKSNIILKQHSAHIIDLILNDTAKNSNQEIVSTISNQYMESENTNYDPQINQSINRSNPSQKPISDYPINYTTAYGLMLGYPIVYWFDGSEAGSCLNMFPLCQSVVVKDGLELYSFTHPQMYSNICDCVINEWFQVLRRIDSHLELRVRLVTLPVVNM